MSEVYVNTSCRSLRIRQVTCCAISGLLPETKTQLADPSPLPWMLTPVLQLPAAYSSVSHGGVVLEPTSPVRFKLGCNIMQKTSCSLAIGSG